VSQTSEPGPSGGPSRRKPSRALDAADRALLAALTEDARLSMRALAGRLHISRANAYARVRRLVDDGVILGFAARISPERAGLGTSAYVSLSIEQQAAREVHARLRQAPYVEHLALVGADFDVLVLVRAPDNATLRDVVLEHIQSIPGVKATRTWLIFAEMAGRGVDWEGLG
jgi:DNA-binding Lrp family transcriptional regulator